MKVFKHYRGGYIIKCASVFLLFLLNPLTAFAKGKGKSIISYFTDSFVFQILYDGGYYTLGVILLLTICSWYSEKFRHVLLSMILAIFGILLLTFIYEALENFEFIPPIYY